MLSARKGTKQPSTSGAITVDDASAQFTFVGLDPDKAESRRDAAKKALKNKNPQAASDSPAAIGSDLVVETQEADVPLPTAHFSTMTGPVVRILASCCLQYPCAPRTPATAMATTLGADPKFDDSAWPQANDGNYPIPSLEIDGYVWLRFRVAVPSGYPGPLALRRKWAETGAVPDEIFVNGQRVVKHGSFPPHPLWAVLRLRDSNALLRKRSSWPCRYSYRRSEVSDLK